MQQLFTRPLGYQCCQHHSWTATMMVTIKSKRYAPRASALSFISFSSKASMKGCLIWNCVAISPFTFLSQLPMSAPYLRLSPSQLLIPFRGWVFSLCAIHGRESTATARGDRIFVLLLYENYRKIVDWAQWDRFINHFSLSIKLFFFFFRSCMPKERIEKKYFLINTLVIIFIILSLVFSLVPYS